MMPSRDSKNAIPNANSMLQIAQITDLHLTPNHSISHEVDVWANFEKILKNIQEQKPDVLVVSGDLCYDVGDIDTYKEVKNSLDALGIPYYVVSGNHDDSLVLGGVFGYQTYQNKLTPYTIEKQGVELHFWDSWDGLIESQWIKNLSRTSLVFVHHPLILGASVFMDSKYAIQNVDEVNAYLAQCSHNHYFFHGHYHMEKSLHTPTHQFFITPSTFYQLDDRSSDFKVASTQIGYRWIEYEQGQLRTQVIYL